MHAEAIENITLQKKKLLMSGILESSSQENKEIAHEILMITSLRNLARQVIAFSIS